MIQDFGDNFAFSRGVRELTDLESIKAILPGCVSIRKTDEEEDRAGIDYVATLRRGAEVFIDSKTRKRGCSKYWKSYPEVALEIWSVRPGGKYGIPWDRRKPGWTLNEKSNVDMIFYSWDSADTKDTYLVGFQSLRMAFRMHFDLWTKIFKHDIQDSKSWESEAIFVPIDVVLAGIRDAAQNTVREPLPLFAE